MSSTVDGWRMPWNCKKPHPLYPDTPKLFKTVSRKIAEESIHNISASKWTGENLLHLRILVKEIDFKHTDGMETADKAMHDIRTIMRAVKALDETALRLPDTQMLSVLRQQDSTIAFTFYAEMRELLTTPYTPNDPDSRVLRPRPEKPADAINEAADSSTDEESTDGSSGPSKKPVSHARRLDEADYVPPPSQRTVHKPVDEIVTTTGTGSFLSWIAALWTEQRGEPSRDQIIRQVSVGQKRYSVNLRLGSYRSRTDGSMYSLQVGQGGLTYTPVEDLETVVDIEAKANRETELLPQHVAELIAHMADRLRKFVLTMNKDSYTSYRDMSIEQRTVYLLCFNETVFRMVWMTFRPRYLEWIFGPLKDILEGKQVVYGKDDIPKLKPPPAKLYQEVYVSGPTSLCSIAGRINVAKTVVYFLQKELPTDKKKSRKLDADILGRRETY